MGGIDIILLIILLVVTWAVASEGIWGASLTSLIVIFSGLLAMNFFEPVAGVLEGISGKLWWKQQCDIFALLGLFAGLVFALRTATDRMAPRFILPGRLIYGLGRWGGGLLAGYVTMAFLLTAMHTGPFPREFWGFKPERPNFFDAMAPDRQWLGFTQWVSERTLKWGGYGKVFDGPRPMPKLGTQANLVWPSFVIRYATRRSNYDSGRAGVSAGGEGRGSPQGVQVQQGSGGSRGPAF